MLEPPLCEQVDWDSDFFQLRIARVTVHRLTRTMVAHIMTWCRSQRTDCLYFLADPDDPETVLVAEENDFRLVDIRVTLGRSLDLIPSEGQRPFAGRIRLCKAEDIPALRSIARLSHRDSRFYYDSHFPISACDSLYETWIEKSCAGYADTVIVAELAGQPVGYVACHLVDPTCGQLGLVSVSPDSQGQGVGERMSLEAFRWLAERGRRRVTVVTQGRNCKAQRFYQRMGFVTDRLQLWYHRWFPPRGTEIPE